MLVLRVLVKCVWCMVPVAARLEMSIMAGMCPVIRRTSNLSIRLYLVLSRQVFLLASLSGVTVRILLLTRWLTECFRVGRLMVLLPVAKGATAQLTTLRTPGSDTWLS